MFLKEATIEKVNEVCKNTMVEHLGIELTEIGADYLAGRMPVDHRTRQPMGLLHGGASVALAETLGSAACALTINQKHQYCVGMEINANHVKSVTQGEVVYGKVSPLHIGKKTQVWEIRITNENGQLVCISRITMAIIDKKEDDQKKTT